MSIPIETLREMERLRARVEELEYELDLMRDAVNAEVASLMDFYDLTATEARLVRALAHAGGAPLSRPVLVDALGTEIDDLRTVDSHVKRIRRKAGTNLPIDSLYGIGYRLLPDTAKQARDVMAGRSQPERHRAHFYVHGAAA
jgi:DNA-binding response OmpR family regulator